MTSDVTRVTFSTSDCATRIRSKGSLWIAGSAAMATACSLEIAISRYPLSRRPRLSKRASTLKSGRSNDDLIATSQRLAALKFSSFSGSSSKGIASGGRRATENADQSNRCVSNKSRTPSAYRNSSSISVPPIRSKSSGTDMPLPARKPNRRGAAGASRAETLTRGFPAFAITNDSPRAAFSTSAESCVFASCIFTIFKRCNLDEVN